MSTIRELFHSLGNKHNIVTVGSSAARKLVKNCLKAEELSEELKDNLSQILKNLEFIIQGALEADKIREELRKRIYQLIAPDPKTPLP